MSKYLSVKYLSIKKKYGPSKTVQKVIFAGSIWGFLDRWYPKIVSKSFLVKYLLILKKAGVLAFAIQKKLIFVGFMRGFPREGVISPNYVEVFVC